ncbi:uncharacterized protein [Miscanthus floridulus]|uniref:uncharacterized protein n=1 Tax=Miscanthus floridulus TaxID=154761 RepID=UPI003457A4EA
MCVPVGSRPGRAAARPPLASAAGSASHECRWATVRVAARSAVQSRAPPGRNRHRQAPHMRSSKERLSKGVFSHAETVGAPVSYQRRDALEELEEASDPHKEELNEVDAPKQDQDEDVVIIEDEKLMEETSAEEPSVTIKECTEKSEIGMAMDTMVGTRRKIMLHTCRIRVCLR